MNSFRIEQTCKGVRALTQLLFDTHSHYQPPNFRLSCSKRRPCAVCRPKTGHLSPVLCRLRSAPVPPPFLPHTRCPRCSRVISRKELSSPLPAGTLGLYGPQVALSAENCMLTPGGERLLIRHGALVLVLPVDAVRRWWEQWGEFHRTLLKSMETPFDAQSTGYACAVTWACLPSVTASVTSGVDEWDVSESHSVLDVLCEEGKVPAVYPSGVRVIHGRGVTCAPAGVVRGVLTVHSDSQAMHYRTVLEPLTSVGTDVLNQTTKSSGESKHTKTDSTKIPADTITAMACVPSRMLRSVNIVGGSTYNTKRRSGHGTDVLLLQKLCHTHSSTRTTDEKDSEQSPDPLLLLGLASGRVVVLTMQGRVLVAHWLHQGAVSRLLLASHDGEETSLYVHYTDCVCAVDAGSWQRSLRVVTDKQSSARYVPQWLYSKFALPSTSRIHSGRSQMQFSGDVSFVHTVPPFVGLDKDIRGLLTNASQVQLSEVDSAVLTDRAGNGALCLWQTPEPRLCIECKHACSEDDENNADAVFGDIILSSVGKNMQLDHQAWGALAVASAARVVERPLFQNTDPLGYGCGRLKEPWRDSVGGVDLMEAHFNGGDGTVFHYASSPASSAQSSSPMWMVSRGFSDPMLGGPSLPLAHASAFASRKARRAAIARVKELAANGPAYPGRLPGFLYGGCNPYLAYAGVYDGALRAEALSSVDNLLSRDNASCVALSSDLQRSAHMGFGLRVASPSADNQRDHSPPTLPLLTSDTRSGSPCMQETGAHQRSDPLRAGEDAQPLLEVLRTSAVTPVHRGDAKELDAPVVQARSLPAVRLRTYDGQETSGTPQEGIPEEVGLEGEETLENADAQTDGSDPNRIANSLDQLASQPSPAGKDPSKSMLGRVFSKDVASWVGGWFNTSTSSRKSTQPTPSNAPDPNIGDPTDATNRSLVACVGDVQEAAVVCEAERWGQCGVFADQRRTAGQCAVSQNPRISFTVYRGSCECLRDVRVVSRSLVALTDSLARVLLWELRRCVWYHDMSLDRTQRCQHHPTEGPVRAEAPRFTLLRMFKGFRRAQCQFVESAGMEYLALYTPVRGILELWALEDGVRVACGYIGEDASLLPARGSGRLWMLTESKGVFHLVVEECKSELDSTIASKGAKPARTQETRKTSSADEDKTTVPVVGANSSVELDGVMESAIDELDELFDF